jgi:uncharacterized phiE125 gp8 family phage protein
MSLYNTISYAGGLTGPYAEKFNWSYNVVTPPAVEPITVDEVAAVLRLSTAQRTTEQDEIISDLITEVREYVECYTGRTLITTGYATFRNGFSDYHLQTNNSYLTITLKKSPFQAVSSVTYLDEDNTSQTVNAANYYTAQDNVYGVVLADTGTDGWPDDLSSRVNTVTITFTAGYGDTADDVPQKIRGAMTRHVAALYSNRGDCGDCTCDESMPSSSKRVYETIKIRRVGC